MILAVDLGSTSFKAAIYDRDLNCLGVGAHPLAYQYAAGGKVELVVDEVTSAFRNAISEAMRASTLERTALHALAVTSQAQTFTVVDRFGQVKMPCISWQDTRATEGAEALRRAPSLAEFAQHASFGQLLPALHLCQLKHLQVTQPEFLRRDDLVLHLPTFLVRLCTGAMVIDDNLAAMSGLYSLLTQAWWEPALEACGLYVDQLPTVVPVASVAARTSEAAEQFGLPAGIPVIPAGNDQTAGAFGAQLPERQAVLLTLGTAQAVYRCTRKLPAPDPAVIRGPYPGERFYQMAADSCGGSIINWAQRILAGGGDDLRFFALAEQSQPGCHGLVFDADLPGGKGEWRNLGMHHTAPDFARSILESLAQRMTQMVHQLDIVPRETSFMVAGGGSSNPIWVRIVEEALGARLTVTEASPLSGAARMARHAL